MDNKDKEIILLKEQIVKLKKQHQKDLQALKDYYENIIALMPGHVYWQDRNNIFLGCNDLQAKNANLKSRHEIVGKTNYDMIWKNQADKLNAINEKVLKTGKIHTCEEFAVMANGPRTYLSQKVPLRNNKRKIIGIIGISIDITERKLAEESEKRALAQAAIERAKAFAEMELRQAVTVLSGSIAHDLRTPLTTILLPTQILKEYIPVLISAYHKANEAGLIKEIPPNFEAKLELISEVDKNISYAVNQMQTFISSTLQTLKVSIKKELKFEDLSECDMWHCVFNAVERYPLSSGERKLIHWQQKDNFKFMGNELIMIRILFNLISNAFHQIRKNNRGEIFICLESNDANHILRFKDTAGGVPPSSIEKMFEAYLTTKKEGTGVGLSFCALMMKNFRGSIEAHTVEGEFIEFILKFPKLKKVKERK